MAYFPAFVQMEGLRVLLVGGGSIAYEKLEKLLDFTEDIIIIALEVSEEVSKLATQHNLSVDKRAYKHGDIDGFDMVVVATDTKTLHQEIYEETRGTRTFVNSVDNTAYCDFIFPSYVQKGDLTVAFSTGGASPALAKKLREYFDKIIPNSVGDFLMEMKKERNILPKGKRRMLHFETLVEAYFSKYFK